MENGPNLRDSYSINVFDLGYDVICCNGLKLTYAANTVRCLGMLEVKNGGH